MILRENKGLASLSNGIIQVLDKADHIIYTPVDIDSSSLGSLGAMEHCIDSATRKREEKG